MDSWKADHPWRNHMLVRGRATRVAHHSIGPNISLIGWIAQGFTDPEIAQLFKTPEKNPHLFFKQSMKHLSNAAEISAIKGRTKQYYGCSHHHYGQCKSAVVIRTSSTRSSTILIRTTTKCLEKDFLTRGTIPKEVRTPLWQLSNRTINIIKINGMETFALNTARVVKLGNQRRCRSGLKMMFHWNSQLHHNPSGWICRQ